MRSFARGVGCLYSWKESGWSGATRALAIRSYGSYVWLDTICIVLVRSQPRVMFASPSGCPSFAYAAPEMKMGMDEPKPRIVAERSVCEMGRSTRGWKKNQKNREKSERAFS